MNFLEQIMDVWDRFCDLMRPYKKKTYSVFQTVGGVIGRIWKVIYNLRKVFAAIPVGVVGVLLALRNSAALPAVVGLGLQIDGSFDFLVVRAIAVLGPLAITAFCLLLMFVSKKILTPWLVSLFSLVIPVFIQITNTFPS